MSRASALFLVSGERASALGAVVRPLEHPCHFAATTADAMRLLEGRPRIGVVVVEPGCDGGGGLAFDAGTTDVAMRARVSHLMRSR